MNKQFLWGGAVASAQIEGAYNVDGRGKSVFDYMPCMKNRATFYIQDKYLKEHPFYPNRVGIDFYHTYKEDIKLLADMGINAFRFSISWSRIFPTGIEETPNEKGLQFYDNVIDELLKYNIEPVITILHYDIPLYLVENYNGFASRKVVDYFERFATTVLERYKDKVKYWMTINEINIMRYSPIDAGIKDVGDNELQTIFQAAHHAFLASAKAVIAHHHICKNSQIGMMLGYEPAYPKTCHPDDVLLAEKSENELLFFSDVCVLGYYPSNMLHYFKENNIHIHMEKEDEEILKQGKVDYIALSYYSSSVCTSNPSNQDKVTRGNIIYGIDNPYLHSTEWGWTIDSKGLQLSLIRLYERYRLPLFIVECGIGVKETLNENNTIEDDYRITYYEEHFKEMQNAIDYGVDVMGFLAWSPIDMPSAASGELEKRYGFIYVDADNNGNGTYKRYKKKSYEWFKNYIKQH